MLGLLPVPLLALVLGVLADDNSVKNYAPQTNVACPDTSRDPLVRVFTPQNQTLHEQEIAYLDARSEKVIPDAWKDWLGNGSAVGYNVEDFGGNFSKVGIAVSGGGYRAAQYGAGVLSALDARNDSAKHAGTGGLLQVASYMSALSGGSWLTGSLFMNNWPTIKDMVYGNGDDLSGWLLDLGLATPGGLNLFNDENQAFFGSLLYSVIAKADAGIDTSLTDPWARMISYHFLNQTNRRNFFTNDTAHGAGQLWSHIPQTDAWKNLKTPFPLICADSRPAGSNATNRLDPVEVVYEITPMEFGSWDPNLSAMVNLTYTGTHVDNLQPDSSTACVTGFDQAGFIMGTSASLFNQILDLTRNTLAEFRNEDGAGLLYVLARQLRSVQTRAEDVANWPNPFGGLKNNTFKDSGSRWLELIDGSSNAENVPFGALFVKARGLDVVVAIDGSANLPDVNWPNGSSVLASERRMSSILLASHQAFPPVPVSEDAFIAAGVNLRPTFFGCNPTNTPAEYPIVIYLPNSPPLTGEDPVSNTGTFKLSYTPKHTRMFLDQVHANVLGGFTPNSNEPDADFGRCLQCAAVDRARTKGGLNITRSSICEGCFNQYCYNPADPPSKDALPNRKLEFVDPDPQGVAKVEGFLGKSKGVLIGGFVGLFVFLAVLIGGLIWWKKRKEKTAYRRVTMLHDDDAESAPWRKYGLSSSSEASRLSATSATSYSYELPVRR